MLDGLINDDLRRMKSVLQYFNKWIVLLVFLVMQMEAFAQRGRFIPQDWGGGGGSSPYSSALSDLWFFLLIAVFLGGLLIVSKLKSINHKNKQRTNSSTESKAVEAANQAKEAQPTSDNASSKVSRFDTPYDEYVYNERKNFLSNLQKGKDKSDVVKEIKDGYNDVFARLGTEMSISAFVAFHGDYVLKQTEDSNHYLQAKDGTCAYLVQELNDSFRQAKEKGETFKLDETKLKVRRYYSTEADAISYKAYYNYKK